MRLIFFFPVRERAMTTSTLFPQKRHRCTLFLASALAKTSVFDFPFSAIFNLLSFSYLGNHKNYPAHLPGTQLPCDNFCVISLYGAG
jgi:hypothetical protein